MLMNKKIVPLQVTLYKYEDDTIKPLQVYCDSNVSFSSSFYIIVCIFKWVGGLSFTIFTAKHVLFLSITFPYNFLNLWSIYWTIFATENLVITECHSSKENNKIWIISMLSMTSKPTTICKYIRWDKQHTHLIFASQ